jgi:recombination protein RecT
MGEIVKFKEHLDEFDKEIAKWHPTFDKVLHDALPAERFLTALRNACVQRPQLLTKCSRNSLIAAALECATLRLEPFVDNQAYIVPFKDVATVIPGYQGLAQLMYRGGRVSQICAGVVYSKDEFDYTDAPPMLRHKRCEDADRGDFTHAYAGTLSLNGDWSWTVMTAVEVGKIQARSPAARKSDSPWNHPDDVNEMRKKTAFRRHYKYQPRAVDNWQLARAMELDTLAETGRPQGLEVASLEIGEQEGASSSESQ